MTEYAIVDDGSIVGYRNFDAPPSLPGKPYRQFLPTEYVTPDYDSATETLTGAYTDDVQSDKVVRTAVVRDKTESEIGQPHLNNGGLARFSGTIPPSVFENIRMAGVTRVSKGRYRATHETAMPSDQYSALASVFDANPRTIRITARTANFVEVRVTDLSGVVQDPTEITIKTERVVTP